MSEIRTAEERMYERNDRWWADFRDFADEGGDREGLVPKGERWATKDRVVAVDLAKARLKELERQRFGNGLVPQQAVRLWAFVPRYLRLKARETEVDEVTVARAKRALQNARSGLRDENGAPLDVFLHEITVKDIRRMRRYLRREYVSPRTGRPLSSRSVRYVTNILSELFKYAAAEGFVPKGFDPVTEQPKRASTRGRTTDFLETYEAAAVLDRLVAIADGIDPHVGLSFIAALTGCRKTEGAGLLTREVDLAKGVVVYHENCWRFIKTRDKGHRAVPIWPQLELFLAAYRKLFDLSPSGLLLPARGDDGEVTLITSVKNRLDTAQEAAADLLDAMGMDHRLWDRAGRARLAREIVPVDDLPSEFRDATVDAIVRTQTYRVAEFQEEDADPEHVRAAKEEARLRYKQVRGRLRDGLDEKRVTVQAWRPTYATARVQTLDHGHPVAEATVAGELGHNSQELLDRVYRHVGKARGTRKEFVEYRLPDGSLPGEAFFREMLGSSEVDRILNDHRFGNGR